eukprot:TRINITY_DN1679_c1_g1_i1.p1 TRINITY_DN1679_c1_g1~~TRINITY_DN1679_c1_g1_i1.p1  ORF type:complete len:408 (+),score=21.14 TRINITY_DN1679_c1_g1_i1:61-1284(+)
MSYSSLKTTRLYSVLGVSPTATQQEIKKEYHALASRYHPDRQGPESSETKFKEIQAAYDVLKDESKRKIYDRYGDEALRVMNSDMAGSPLLMGISPQFMALAGCSLLIPLFLTFLFMSLNVDGTVSWSWSATLIPFWIVATCIVIERLAFLLSQGSISMFRKVVLTFQPLLPLIFVLLLALELDGTMHSWGSTFLPLILFCIMELIMISRRSYRMYESKCAELGIEATEGSYKMMQAWGVFSQVRNLSFLVLLWFKLADYIHVSYAVISIPVWVGFGLSFCVNYWLEYRIIKDDPQGEYLSKLVAGACLTIVPLVIFLLIILKADGAGYSMAVAFIPIWIILGLTCCLLCCLCFMPTQPVDGAAGPPAEYQAAADDISPPAPPTESTPVTFGNEATSGVTQDLNDID